jgi:alpha-L-fucosidase
MVVLDGITAWMAVNSEGIYSSRPWKIYGEGPSTKVKIEAGNFNEDKQKDLTQRMFASPRKTARSMRSSWVGLRRQLSSMRSASPAIRRRADSQR